MPLDQCEAHVNEVAVNLVDTINRMLPVENQVKDVQYSPSTKKLLVRLPDDDNVISLEPSGTSGSMSLLKNGLTSSFSDTIHAAHPEGSIVRGVIVSVTGPRQAEDAAEAGFDFQSRYFAPWVGIPEDPVTGSAHTVSAPYMAAILGDDGTGPRGHCELDSVVNVEET